MDTGYHDWRERHLELETTITIETVPGDVSFNLTICRDLGYSTLNQSDYEADIPDQTKFCTPC